MMSSFRWTASTTAAKRLRRAALLLSGAAAMVLGTAGAGAASLAPPMVFAADFEAGSIDTSSQWVVSGNSPTVTTAYVREGKYAIKTFLDRKNSPTSYRTELAMRSIRAQPDVDYWYGFSIYLPSDYVADSIWEIVAQWHAVPDKALGEGDLNPPVSLHSENGKWKVSTIWDAHQVTTKSYDGSRSYDLGAYKRGVWTDWVFHIKWSPNSDGLLQVWEDGKQVINTPGPIGFNDAVGPYFKFGLYKGWRDRSSPVGLVTTRTLYHDSIRMASGPTAKYADVAPPSVRRPLPPLSVKVN